MLVGINLLREGLDIPECQRVMILDADKEGFLRSKTSLVQTIGRAARNVEGKAILYADRVTESMQYAMDETQRRREKQMAHNAAHGITPETIKRAISGAFDHVYDKGEEGLKARAAIGEYKWGLHDSGDDEFAHAPAALKKRIEAMKKDMLKAAENLEFEEAARLRDEIKRLEDRELGL